MRKMGKKKFSLILHDIRSVQNVASIFRTADALSVEKIYISGFTPSPVDRFGRTRPDFIKISLGAEENVPWIKVNNVHDTLKELSAEGHTIIAIEQSADSIDYKKIKPNYPAVFIMGNEVEGLPADILKKANYVAEISMLGKKESLNVSVAFAVSAYRILGI